MPWILYGSFPLVLLFGDPSEPATSSVAPLCHGIVVIHVVNVVSNASGASTYTAALLSSTSSIFVTLTLYALLCI